MSERQLIAVLFSSGSFRGFDNLDAAMGYAQEMSWTLLDPIQVMVPTDGGKAYRSHGEWTGGKWKAS